MFFDISRRVTFWFTTKRLIQPNYFLVIGSTKPKCSVGLWCNQNNKTKSPVDAQKTKKDYHTNPYKKLEWKYKNDIKQKITRSIQEYLTLKHKKTRKKKAKRLLLSRGARNSHRLPRLAPRKELFQKNCYRLKFY